MLGLSGVIEENKRVSESKEIYSPLYSATLLYKHFESGGAHIGKGQ